MLATDTDLLIQLDQRPVWDSCLKIIRRMAAVGAEWRPMFEIAASGFVPKAEARF
jgi:hypothetical protein